MPLDTLVRQPDSGGKPIRPLHVILADHLMEGRALLRTVATLLLLTFTIPLAGCVVYARPGSNFCYYHPYRCGR